MSDREIYSYRDSLADLVTLLKNGQRGIDEGSGDWVVKDYSGVSHAMLSYKHWSGSTWVYDPITLGQITLSGVTANRILTTNGSSVITAATLNDIGAQPIDGDLTSLAALTGTGVAVRSADNTWLLRTISVMGNGIAAMNGNGVAGDPTIYLDIGPSATQVAAGNHNHGIGTVNYLTKWSNTTGGLSSSLLFDSGSSVGLGTTSPSSLLHLNSTSSLWFSIENDAVGNDLFQIGLSSAGKATFRSNHSGFEFLGIPYLGQSETAIFGVSANNIIIGYPSYINYSRTDLYGTVAVDAIYFDRTNLTVSNLTTAKVTDLTDAGDTSLHYHSADRDRGNHTGSQAISTITGLQTALDDKFSSWGLALAGRIPYFYSSNSLANSLLYCSARGIRFKQEPSNWGSSYSAMELGLNAIWGYTSVVDGYPLHISNNRYNDGTGDKPYVNGSSISYILYDRTHRWSIDTGLTAGVTFTPTERMRLSTSGLYLHSLTANTVLIANGTKTITSSVVTPTELGCLLGVTSSVQTQLNGKISGSGLTANYLPMYNGSSLVNSVFQQSASMMSGVVGQFKFGNSSLNFINSGYTNTIAGWCCNAELKEVGGIPMYHSVVSGSVGILRNNGLNFEFCINTATSAGQQLAIDTKMRLSETGLFLSGLTANTVLVANASRYVTSSAVTLTELNLLSGKTDLIGGSGTAGQFPIFTASGSVGNSYFSYIAGSSRYLWATASIAELMSLTPEHLWINAKMVCNGLSTGDNSTISTTSSSYSIDVSTLTQYNIKFTSTISTSVMLWKAKVGDIIYLTNVGASQVNINYDGESGGPAKELYPGQTMMLMCFNTYGYYNWYSTWAIWRTEINPSSHLND